MTEEKKKQIRIVYAKLDGTLMGETPIVVHKGQAWDADDPIVSRFKEVFTEDPSLILHRSPAIETATRAPGERRPVVGNKPVRG